MLLQTVFKKALAVNTNLLVAEPKEAVQSAEVVFLATPFGVNQAIIKGLQSELEGKSSLTAPTQWVSGFTHGLNNEQSGRQRVRIQSLIPNSHVVKAFSIYGFENLKKAQSDSQITI